MGLEDANLEPLLDDAASSLSPHQPGSLVMHPSLSPASAAGAAATRERMCRTGEETDGGERERRLRERERRRLLDWGGLG
jgi:hypothetical protein